MTPLAVIRSYRDVHAAMRARADRLGFSRETIDGVAGLPAGYASKVLGPRPPKKLGAMSTFAILGALGVELVMVESPELLARARMVMAKKGFAKRQECNVRTAVRITVLTQRYMRKLAKKAAVARLKKINPRRRRKLARRAANARWRAKRKAAVSDPHAQAACATPGPVDHCASRANLRRPASPNSGSTAATWR